MDLFNMGVDVKELGLDVVSHLYQLLDVKEAQTIQGKRRVTISQSQ